MMSSRLLIQQIRWILINQVNYRDAPQNWNPKILILDHDLSPTLFTYTTEKGKSKVGIQVGRPWIISEINNRIYNVTADGKL